ITVESEYAAELPLHTTQHPQVLIAGVRVEGRHDAAGSEIVHADDDFTDAKSRAFPLSLGESFCPSDDQVGTKAPLVVAYSGKRAIRHDQQGEHVETVIRVAADKAGSRACRLLNLERDILCIPRVPVHQ